MECRRENESIYRQTIEILRDDAKMKTPILMLTTSEKKKMIQSVLTSNSNNELVFEKKMLAFCFIENHQFHNSKKSPTEDMNT